MESIADKSLVRDTYNNIRDFSYTEKKYPRFTEAKINFFLDAILDFKKELKEKTEEIFELTNLIEKLTWFDDIEEECLKMINEIISLSKELRHSMVRQYATMSAIRRVNIAGAEIKDFKSSIDSLKEAYETLDLVFFELPNDTEFSELNKELSNL